MFCTIWFFILLVVNYSHQVLAHDDFKNTTSVGKIFHGVNFKNQDLSGARFISCTFTSCEFSGANCTHAVFDGCEFNSVTAEYTDFSFASMCGVHIDANSNFNYSNFYKVDFSSYNNSETFLGGTFHCALFDSNKATSNNLQQKLLSLHLSDDGLNACIESHDKLHHYPPMNLNFTPLTSGDTQPWYKLSNGDWEHVYRAHPYYPYALAHNKPETSKVISDKVIASCGVLEHLDIGGGIKQELLSNCFYNAMQELQHNSYSSATCPFTSISDVDPTHQALSNNPLDELYTEDEIMVKGSKYTFKSLANAVQKGAVTLSEADVDTICSRCSPNNYEQDKVSAQNPCTWASGAGRMFRFQKPIYNCINTCKAALKKVPSPVKTKRIADRELPVLQFGINESFMPYRW